MLNLLAEVGFNGSSIITTIIQAITLFLSGIGSSIADFFSSTFTQTDGSLTIFAIVSLVFIGLGISMFFVRMIIKKIGG